MTMKREEAIRLIGWLKCTTNREDDLEAIDMAIEALSQPIVAKHFDIQSGYIYCSPQIAENVKVVVRCKDCKHWLQHEQFGFDEDNDEYHDYCGLLIPEDEYYAYTRKSDDYCSYGERKGGDSE